MQERFSNPTSHIQELGFLGTNILEYTQMSGCILEGKTHIGFVAPLALSRESFAWTIHQTTECEIWN